MLPFNNVKNNLCKQKTFNLYFYTDKDQLMVPFNYYNRNSLYIYNRLVAATDIRNVATLMW